MITRVHMKSEAISLRANKKKGRSFHCPLCDDPLPFRSESVLIISDEKISTICAFESAISYFHKGMRIDAQNQFLKGLRQLNIENDQLPNLARKITNACGLYEKRFPKEEELSCPTNILLDFRAWMESRIVEFLEAKEEKFLLTLQMRDILIKNNEEIEKRRSQRDQALINFQNYEAPSSDKLDNIERFLNGAQKGIDSMKKHVLDEAYDPEKKSALMEKIKEKEKVKDKYVTMIEEIKQKPEYKEMIDTENDFVNMWKDLGIIQLEAQIDLLRPPKLVDNFVGSDFEIACEYFVKMEVKNFEDDDKTLKLINKGVFFEGISVPLKVTGEFDYIVGVINEHNEFEVYKIFECKNSSTSVQSDIRKKVESMGYFTGLKPNDDGKLFTKTTYTPPGTKIKYNFTQDSFKRFKSVDDIFKNLNYLTLPVYLEPFEMICKLTLESRKSVFRTHEFYQEAFKLLHEIEDIVEIFEAKQEGFKSLLQMIGNESIFILDPIVDFEQVSINL